MQHFCRIVTCGRYPQTALRRLRYSCALRRDNAINFTGTDAEVDQSSTDRLADCLPVMERARIALTGRRVSALAPRAPIHLLTRGVTAQLTGAACWK